MTKLKKARRVANRERAKLKALKRAGRTGSQDFEVRLKHHLQKIDEQARINLLAMFSVQAQRKKSRIVL